MSFIKNTAGQFLYFTLVNVADGSPITAGVVTVVRSIDGGAQGAVTGVATHKGNGQYELALSQADTNGDEIGFYFTHATAVAVSITIVTIAAELPSASEVTTAVWTDTRNTYASLAGSFGESFSTMVSGMATATNTSTSMTTTLTETADDFYVGRTVVWTSGAMRGAAAAIVDYVGATKTLSFTVIAGVPVIGDQFLIV